MKNSFLLLLLSAFVQFTFAQSLTITNGTKEKTFKPGSFYEIIIAENEEVLKNDCCDWSTLEGTLSSMTADSLNMQLTSYSRRMIVDGIKIEHERYGREGSNFGSFASSDIFSLKYYKSEKSKKIKSTLMVVGGILLFTATATSVNTFILPDKDNRTNLWQSAGVQAGTSIAFLILSSSKQYKFKGDEGKWRIK